jgi:hypothetical protein
MALCVAAFTPALWIGGRDLAACWLAGMYLTHGFWFVRMQPAGMGNWPEYGMQLFLLNAAVVFVRTLFTMFRRGFNADPFRVAVIFFSAVSLVCSLGDKTIAWQVFGAYGVLALLVSFILYEGRYRGVGATLLMLSYELFLRAQGVTLVEVYAVPAGLYLLMWGYLQRDRAPLRDLLYAAAQVILYGPAFFKAIPETWELHGLYVGVVSLTLMLFGITQNNRCLIVGGCGMMLLNGVVQSWNLIRAIPRWIYLACSGSLLIALGALVEFQKEWIIGAGDKARRVWSLWE